MKLLVAAAKADFGPRLDEAMAELRPLLKPGLTPVSTADLPWTRVLQAEGSFDGAYRWAARNYAACCLVETAAGALGRGTFQIAQEFLRLGKRMVVLRSGKLHRVVDVAETGAGDWKQNYGSVILGVGARCP